MADNVSIKDSTGSTVNAATDELSDSSQSPKVSVLDGTGSPTAISPATSGKQDTGNTTLASILAKIIAAPATEAKQDTLIATDFATQTTLAAILAKLIAAPSTEAKQDDIITALGSLVVDLGATDNAVLDAIAASLDGTLTVDTDVSGLALESGGNLAAIVSALAGTLTAQPSTDQDPVFDTANGDLTAVTTSAVVLTPPTGCKYARFSTDADCVLNTEGSAAVDDGTAVRLYAGVPEIFPVVAGTGVYALSISGTANVYAMPLKVRA
jgi:hypothetical protein